jgi:hypothetical protein
MKKSLLVLLCVLGLGVAGLASAQSNSFSSIQRLLNTLEGQMAALKSEQSAQVASSVTAKKITTVKNSDSAVSVTSSDDPITGNDNPVPGGVVVCAGGATMPRSSEQGQVIYCNGSRWAVAPNLRLIDGQKLFQAFDSTTFGPVKNVLSWLGLNGVTNPTQALDLGDNGKIRMGYEVVTGWSPTVSNTVVTACPAGKFVISGGCSGPAGAGAPRSFGPTASPDFFSAYQCTWASSEPAGTLSATAICANIR